MFLEFPIDIKREDNKLIVSAYNEDDAGICKILFLINLALDKIQYNEDNGEMDIHYVYSKDNLEVIDYKDLDMKTYLHIWNNCKLLEDYDYFDKAIALIALPQYTRSLLALYRNNGYENT